jgi:tRNA (guanine37-N1)-methyltransferase
MIQFDILTIFPQMLVSPLGESILKKAQLRGLIKIVVHNLREYTSDKHLTTDDTPYGGGAGMVMKVEPIVEALEHVKSQSTVRAILMSPQGELFTQQTAERLSAYEQVILVCGRYEGVDERVQFFIDEELSIGDYIITGGELAAMVIVDTVARLIPDVVGERASVLEDSISSSLLKYPQYTRPRNFRGLEVPDTLLSGDHEKIAQWRRVEALKKTLHRRPDLLQRAGLTEDDKKILAKLTKYGD